MTRLKNIESALMMILVDYCDAVVDLNANLSDHCIDDLDLIEILMELEDAMGIEGSVKIDDIYSFQDIVYAVDRVMQLEADSSTIEGYYHE